MELINIRWLAYLKNDSEFDYLNDDLTILTKNFINKYFKEYIDQWQDIYHDVLIKVINLKNEINEEQHSQIKNFKEYFFRIIQNHIKNMIRDKNKQQNGLMKYKYNIENDLKHKENQMEKTDIFIRFTKIMASVKNQTHVKIFIEFVKGTTIQELSVNYNLSTHNIYKVVERMRMKCIELWKKEIRSEVEVIINRAKKESKIVFGNKDKYAIETLIQELMDDLETQSLLDSSSLT